MHEVPPGHLAAVVTHLEMTAPPEARPPATGAGATLHRLTDPDPASYLRLFRQVGADWLWFSRLRLPEPELAAVLTAEGTEIHVARQGTRDIGLLELDFRAAPVAELAFFGLVPGMAGQGLGRWLMNRALALAWDRDRPVPITALTLHTCTLDSAAALPFYLKSGFRAVRREVEIAPDPRLDGTLPATAAPHIPVIAG